LSVIATNVGNISELIQDSKNGLLIPSKNQHALNQALHTILDDKDFSRTIAEQLYQTVTTNYSLEAMVSHTRAIYNK
jgi:glycosyltransferase involved in cell wall biosynthesis